MHVDFGNLTDREAIGGGIAMSSSVEESFMEET